MKFLPFILLVFFGLSGVFAQPRGVMPGAPDVIGAAGNEGNSNFEVRIFPNPVTDKRVNIELTEQTIQELRITNIGGAIIFSKKFSIPVNRHQVLLDNIPNGVYLLRVTTPSNQTRSLKLMIRNQ